MVVQCVRAAEGDVDVADEKRRRQGGNSKRRGSLRFSRPRNLNFPSFPLFFFIPPLPFSLFFCFLFLVNWRIGFIFHFEPFVSSVPPYPSNQIPRAPQGLLCASTVMIRYDYDMIRSPRPSLLVSSRLQFLLTRSRCLQVDHPPGQAPSCIESVLPVPLLASPSAPMLRITWHWALSSRVGY